MGEQHAGGALWRRPAVEAQTGLSRAEIYRRMKEGTFPRPVRLGARVVAWQSWVIQEWINSRPQQN